MVVQTHLLLHILLPLYVTWLPIALASSWRIPATEVKYRLEENRPPGHVLGIVASSAPQKSAINAFGAPSQLFHLDPITSELSLKAEIDAEKLCNLASWRDDKKGGWWRFCFCIIYAFNASGFSCNGLCSVAIQNIETR